MTGASNITSVRLTAGRKKAIRDFDRAYSRAKYNENTDRKITPFYFTYTNGAPMLIDGVIFHGPGMTNEFSLNCPNGTYQMLVQEQCKPKTGWDADYPVLGWFGEADKPVSFSYEHDRGGTRYYYIWVRANDQSAVFAHLTKWLADKAMWLKILSA